MHYEVAKCEEDDDQLQSAITHLLKVNSFIVPKKELTMVTNNEVIICFNQVRNDVFFFKIPAAWYIQKYIMYCKVNA